MKIRVVTDSTSDLPTQIVRDLGITVVPALIQFGDKVYRDGVDLSTELKGRFFRQCSLLLKSTLVAFLVQNGEPASSLHLTRIATCSKRILF
jgi:hypothetical protein